MQADSSVFHKMDIIVNGGWEKSVDISNSEKDIIYQYVENYRDYVFQTKQKRKDVAFELKKLIECVDIRTGKLYRDLYNYLENVKNGRDEEVISEFEIVVINDYFKLQLYIEG